MNERGLLTAGEDPITMGLLQAAAALATPQRQGGGYGAAMMAFPQAMQQAQMARRQRESDEMQRELFGFTKEKTGLELQTLRENLARQARIREQLSALSGGGSSQPAAPGGLTPAGNVPIPQGMSFQQMGRTDMAPAAPAAAAAVPPRMAQFQRAMAVADIYERNGAYDEANKMRGDATKLLPEVNKIETVMVRGKPTQRIVFKDGTYQDMTDADPAVNLSFQNGVGYHPLTGKPMAEAGDVNQPFMPQIRDGRVAGVANPQVQDYQLNKARAGAPSVTVTGEKAFEKEVGEFFGKQYGDIQKAGMDAYGKINRLQRLGSMLEGINTGKFTPAATELKSALASMGLNVDPKGLGNAEAASAISNELALQMRNPSGGAGMPGAMSDKDREFLQQTVPGLARTPEGNRMLIESYVRLAKRDQDVAKLAREYRSRKGKLDEGFYDGLQAWSAANPLFDDLQPAGPRATPIPDAAPRQPLGMGGGGATLQDMAAAEIQRRAQQRQAEQRQ